MMKKAGRAIRTRTVAASRLRPGDEIVGRDGQTYEVVQVWHDPEGVWLETDDGDQGYVRANARFKVAR